jgi:hypothetical protein
VDALISALTTLWSTPPVGDERDGAAFRAVYADPVTLNGTPVPVDDLVERHRSLHASFAELMIELVDLAEADGALTVVLRQSGRHVGALDTPVGPVAASERRFDVLGIDLLRVADGRVATIWVVADELGRLVQLGALAPPVAPPVLTPPA